MPAEKGARRGRDRLRCALALVRAHACACARVCSAGGVVELGFGS